MERRFHLQVMSNLVFLRHVLISFASEYFAVVVVAENEKIPNNNYIIVENCSPPF